MEGAKRAGRIALLVAVGAFAVVWLGVSISTSIDIWSDRCPFDEFRCDFGAADDAFAAFQLAVALGGVWLLVRRRWAWAAGVFAFWFFVPFLLLAISQQ